MLYRRAGARDVDLMLEWARDEGWNPGRDDASAFLASDPEGFMVAEADGEVVASISVVNHSDSFAFLGLYICRPDWRGRGVGFALWQHALAHAGDRTVGLDGVADQQANYARSGFVLHDSTRRWQGVMEAAQSDAARPATAKDIPALAALDSVAWGIVRERFLEAWIRESPTRYTVMSIDGSGFATARRCADGVKIGPVVAPDAATSLVLARAALAGLGVTTETVAIDVLASKGELSARLRALDFSVGFETARMYRGAAPAAGHLGQAIATMELG